MILPRPLGAARIRIGEIRQGSSPRHEVESGQILLDSIKALLIKADRVQWIEVANVAGDFSQVDALVCLEDPGKNFILNVQRGRSQAGLPNHWPLLAAKIIPLKGQDSGFGGIQIGLLTTAEDLLLKATAYRQIRKAQSASALRSVILAMSVLGLILVGSLWFGLGGRDRFAEVLFELAQTDHSRLERRLEVSPLRLKYQADLLNELTEHPRWIELTSRDKEHLLDRKQELDKFLPWQVEAQKIPPPEDLFSLVDFKEASQRVGRLIDNAEASWSVLDSFKQAKESQEQFSKVLTLAQDRLFALRGEYRKAVDLASWESPAPKDIEAWQKEARGLLSAKIPLAVENVEKLLEVVEVRAALERALEQIRAQRGWLSWLSLGERGTPTLETILNRGGQSVESIVWRDSVQQFPGAFRDRVAVPARKAESDCVAMGILALETIWPGRNPTLPIPMGVVEKVATHEKLKEFRKWIIALRILQIPSNRSLPEPASLDPWGEVERFVSRLPKEFQPTRLEVEGPLDAAVYLGDKQKVRLASGSVDWVLDKSVRDDFPGKGTFTLAFEIPEKKAVSLQSRWTGRLVGEKLQVLWDEAPVVPWAAWTTLQLPGIADPPSRAGKGSWRLRLTPPLPEIPALLGPK